MGVSEFLDKGVGGAALPRSQQVKSMTARAAWCVLCSLHVDMRVPHIAGAESQRKGQAHAWAEQREPLEE